VYVLVLEAGGGELGVAATAAALALADAGIELFDIVVACSVVSGCWWRAGLARMHMHLLPVFCCSLADLLPSAVSGSCTPEQLAGCALLAARSLAQPSLPCPAPSC
jgi:hypothetical protein